MHTKWREQCLQNVALHKVIRVLQRARANYVPVCPFPTLFIFYQPLWHPFRTFHGSPNTNNDLGRESYKVSRILSNQCSLRLIAVTITKLYLDVSSYLWNYVSEPQISKGTLLHDEPVTVIIIFFQYFWDLTSDLYINGRHNAMFSNSDDDSYIVLTPQILTWCCFYYLLLLCFLKRHLFNLVQLLDLLLQCKNKEKNSKILTKKIILWNEKSLHTDIAREKKI